MSDDTKHPGEQHIPTPAEVRAEHPTVLVPVPPADEVRRIETHDGEQPSETAAAVAEPTSVPAPTPVVESTPVGTQADTAADDPVVDLEFSSGRETHGDELAQVIAEAAGVVPGVHGLGSSTARAIDSARTRLLGRTAVPGVSILDDAGTLNVEVDLVAEYPANVSEVADTVRADVASALESRHDGPVDIDITVTDVHGPFDPVEPDPGEFLDDAAEAVEGAKAKAGAAFEDAKAAVGDAVDTTKAVASDAADAVQAGAADAADAAVDAIDRAKHDAADAIDDAADDIDGTRDDAAADDVAPAANADVETEPVVPTVPAPDAELTPSDGPADEMAEAAKKLAEAADALAIAAEGVAQDAEDEAQRLEAPVDESLAEESQAADPQSAGDQPESAHPESDQR